MIDVVINIYNYIKKNWVLLTIILGAILVISTLIVDLGCKNNEIKIAKNNLFAVTDSVRKITTKNGELISEKVSYIATIKELEQYMDISKQEIKELQKALDNKILYISALESSIEINPTEVHDTILIEKDSTYEFSFKFQDQWYGLDGYSSINRSLVKTKINELYVNVPLQVGLTDDWEIFVSSSNPYVNIKNIDGALLDKNVYLKQKNPRRLGLGANLGLNVGYDPIQKHIYAGPGVGFGVYYRIW